MIMYACIWSFGGCLDEIGRKKFNHFFRDIFLNLTLPSTNITYDYGPYNLIEMAPMLKK